ncbi:restriction endonuclease subunit S [Mariprofundus erugo]|uniref:Restriction endonuclease subunit S n=1 Tax=Mariprofundus erugo TaxID=2528639 RepID=A0A5R9GSF9_9PROT|nr:restriction endonuclease subunit S [Mariprofundus erugo]TLS66184.1 restriction endonuclease subunit S [Mariprofundus erugo]
MRKVILSQVCDISSGGTPSRNNPEFFRGEIPWAKISDIENSDNGFVYETEEKISDEGLKNIRGRLFPKGTLLFSMYGSIGKVAFAGRDLSTNQAILGIRRKPNEEIDLSYLKCWFESNKQKLINKGQGVALKNLSATIVKNLEVELPPLDDQKRIAHLLGKVEGLIAQRKQHLQQLDDLLKSVFLEMFGPKAPGYDDWPQVEIKDLAAKHKGAMRTGPFGSNLLHSEFTTEGDVAVIGIDNAVQNRFAWGERRFITNEKYKELQNYRIYPGDVIVSIMGTIGRSAVIPDHIPLAINTKHLAAITLNRDIAHPIFLSYSIHSSPFILNQFRSKNRGAIMSGLNLGLIKETKLKRPPIELQNHFAAIHTKTDEVKASYQQSLACLENLYGALSQNAFKGELDLSRISLTGDK